MTALTSKPPPARAIPTIRASGATSAAVSSNLARHAWDPPSTGTRGRAVGLGLFQRLRYWHSLLSGPGSGRLQRLEYARAAATVRKVNRTKTEDPGPRPAARISYGSGSGGDGTRTEVLDRRTGGARSPGKDGGWGRAAQTGPQPERRDKRSRPPEGDRRAGSDDDGSSPLVPILIAIAGARGDLDRLRRDGPAAPARGSRPLAPDEGQLAR